ncbi:hypothetical protein [Chitinophaga rhizosphaerae]|uniref:hypothetical protein n=1 Tax=Chitinophaga rhizosphaerae TaxID=1864947 RepID=UPI000F811DA4|nr:hypothetical protein [Chitinophaga rhizosphaerae]
MDKFYALGLKFAETSGTIIISAQRNITDLSAEGNTVKAIRGTEHLLISDYEYFKHFFYTLRYKNYPKILDQIVVFRLPFTFFTSGIERPSVYTEGDFTSHEILRELPFVDKPYMYAGFLLRAAEAEQYYVHLFSEFENYHVSIP